MLLLLFLLPSDNVQHDLEHGFIAWVVACILARRAAMLAITMGLIIRTTLLILLFRFTHLNNDRVKI